MKVIVGGIATEYEDAGAGPTLLLLHGWMHSLRSFDALADELSSRFRVVRFDFPGFGGSERPHAAWHIEDYAKFTAAFIAKVGISPAALIGHSFGGRVIIKGVGSGILQAPKVALIASAGNARRRTPGLAFYWLLAKLGKGVAFIVPPLGRMLRAKLYARAGSDYLAAGDMKEIFLHTIREDLSKDAARVRVPALLVWGAHDDTTPLADGQRLAETMGDATFMQLPGGHLVHQEQSAAVAERIAAFV